MSEKLKMHNEDFKLLKYLNKKVKLKEIYLPQYK